MSARWILMLAVALACASCNKEEAKAPATPAPAAAATSAAKPATATTTAAAPTAPAARDRVFTQEELAQMVAPIALYPDPLLAQVLMAATYPGDVADAAAWSKEHPDAKGDAAVKLVANEQWDPSVQSLVAFPQALATLGQDPAWVQRLGDAFLAQPDNVMDAVQVLRHKAQDAGNLATNEYQKISTQPARAHSEPAPVYDDSGSGAMVQAAPAASTDVIVIESANPETVYVPAYNPTTVYGTWAYPSYPPPYYPPPSYYYPGSALMRGLAWGTGVAIAGSLWGDMDWNNNDVNINVNRYNSVNTNRQISNSNWQHNAANRDGVPYRDQGSREKFSNRLPDSASRDRMRGDDAKRAQARESMERRGMDAPARTNREAQERAQTARHDVEARGGADRARADARDRAGGGDRDAARNRAAASADRASAANRANAGGRQQNDGNRQADRNRQSEQHRQQGANNRASRDSARQQANRQQRPQNDAFAGARSPQQSRAASQRGHSSQNQSRQRQSGGGQRQSSQVNRQPRSGGGGQQRQASQRAPSGGRASGGGHRR